MQKLRSTLTLNSKSIIVAVIFLGITVGYLRMRAQVNEKTSLWKLEPKISLDYWRTGGWWILGYRSGPSNRSYEIVVSRLREYLDSNASQTIVEKYCQRFVNSFNNTVFVVVKSLDPDVTEAFLEVMQPPHYVDVKFMKGYANWEELENWEKIIGDEVYNLHDLGVTVTQLGKSANATIMMMILDIDLKKVNIVLDVLEGRVPPGILAFYRGAHAVLH